MLNIIQNYEDTAYWEQLTQGYLNRNWCTYEEAKNIWAYFKHCLKTQNRFFFANPLLSHIEEQFNNHVIELPVNTNIYRARIDDDGEHYEQCWLARNYMDLQHLATDKEFHDYFANQAKQIAESESFQQFLSRYVNGFEGFDAQNSGAPPFNYATAGRCNPENVSFLYASNDEHTATAEVRPYIRSAISVAILRTKRNLKLVDFYYENNEQGVRVIDNNFFEQIRGEFSKLNKGNKEEYLVTQYLSLLAKNLGFDGIRFRSSLVEKGTNYVIFDSGNCIPISSKMYVLKKVEYNLWPILLDEEKDLILNEPV